MSSQKIAQLAVTTGLILSGMMCLSTSAADNTAADKNKFAVPVKEISNKQKIENAKTAKAINKIPGVNLQASDLQPPAQDPPIKGFHPIKRALQPVVNLEKNSV